MSRTIYFNGFGKPTYTKRLAKKLAKKMQTNTPVIRQTVNQSGDEDIVVNLVSSYIVPEKPKRKVALRQIKKLKEKYGRKQ